MSDPSAYAAILVESYRSGRRPALGDVARGMDRADGPAVHAAVAAALGCRVEAWKVSIPEGVGTYAPMFDRAVKPSGTAVAQIENGFLVEIELAVRLISDLAPRPGRPWTRDEVAAACGEALVGIELVAGRQLGTPPDVPFPAWFGDNMGNHTYAVGASVPFAAVASRLDSLRCTVTVDGAVSHDAPGHPLGDPLKPLVACANAQVDRFGGFRAGQLVTLGSINKPVLVTGPATLTGALDGIGTVTVVLTA